MLCQSLLICVKLFRRHPCHVPRLSARSPNLLVQGAYHCPIDVTHAAEEQSHLFHVSRSTRLPGALTRLNPFESTSSPILLLVKKQNSALGAALNLFPISPTIPSNRTMMTVNHNDGQPKLDLKRKRIPDTQSDELGLSHERLNKRANLARLPIRLTPSSPQHYLWHDRASAFVRPLTPVDSSDEEAAGQAEDPWGYQHDAKAHSHRFSTHSLASITVNIDAAEDQVEDMDISTSPSVTTAQLLPATLKHPLLSNSRQRYLAAPPVSLDERVPTPISDKFNLFEDSPKTRNWRTSRPTILSPVMAEELSFPSPIESISGVMSVDPETVVSMEHTSDGFGALSVTCDADLMMQDSLSQEEPAPSSRQPDIRNSRHPGKNAKLHMGFRADCEKCQQRVPGHYSHILWT